MASHVNTVDALSDSDMDAPTQELPGGGPVENATPPTTAAPIPSPKTPAKPKRLPSSSKAAAAPKASKGAGATLLGPCHVGNPKQYIENILQSCSYHNLQWRKHIS